MEEVKIKRYKGSLLLKVAVFCFACFMVTMLVGQQISISQKKDELQQLKNELKEQQVVNDELRYDLNEENADNTDYAGRFQRKRRRCSGTDPCAGNYASCKQRR